MEGGQSVLDWVASQASGSPPQPRGGGTVMDWLESQAGASQPKAAPPDTSGFDIRPEEPGIDTSGLFKGPQGPPRAGPPEPTIGDYLKSGGAFAANAAAQGFADIGEETARLGERLRQNILKKTNETPEEKAENERRLAHPPSPFGIVEKMRALANAPFKPGVISPQLEGGAFQAGSEAVGGLVPGVGAALAAPEVALPAMVGLGGAQSAGSAYNRVLQATGDPEKAAKAEAAEGAVGAAGSLATLGAFKGFPALQGLSQPVKALMGTFLAAGENGVGGGAQAALNTVIENKLTGEQKDAWQAFKDAALPSAFGGAVAHGAGAIRGAHAEGEATPATDFERANTIAPEKPPTPAQETGAGGQGGIPTIPGERLPEAPEAGKAGEATEVNLGDRRAVERTTPERRRNEEFRQKLQAMDEAADLKAHQQRVAGDELGAAATLQEARQARSKALEEEHVKARTDALTGLPNRLDWAERDLTGRHVVSIDLDGQKWINDNVSHDAGDKYLQAAADVIRREDPEGTIGRTGGDEFLGDKGSPEEAKELAERVQKKLAETTVDLGVDKDGNRIIKKGIQASVGHGPSMGEADKAMYENKAQRVEQGLRRAKNTDEPPGVERRAPEQPAPAESAALESARVDPADVRSAIERYAAKGAGVDLVSGRTIGAERALRQGRGEPFFEAKSQDQQAEEFARRASEDLARARSEADNPVEYMLDRALDPLDPMGGLYRILLKAHGATDSEESGLRLGDRLERLRQAPEKARPLLGEGSVELLRPAGQARQPGEVGGSRGTPPSGSEERVPQPASPGLPLFKKPPKSREAGAVDLFGQRKPEPEETKPDKLGFYSPIEKALNEKMPNVADVEHVKNIAKAAQPREYEFSGLEDFLKGKQRVTKKDVRDYLRANNVDVQEKVLGGPDQSELEMAEGNFVNRARAAGYAYGDAANDLALDIARGDRSPNDLPEELRPHAERVRNAYAARNQAGEGPAKFGQYQTPGGENYRELLLTMPDEGGRALREGRPAPPGGFRQNFMGGHFPEPNVLAHIRFNDRTDAQGRKTLFLEEVQSDWAAKGEREGFGPKTVHQIIGPDGMLEGVRPTREEAQARADQLGPGASVVPQEIPGKVPNMPFKTREQYAKLALRRMIRYAAENGYDSVSWTTGEQQAERYDLSKQLGSLQVTRKGDGFELHGVPIGSQGEAHDFGTFKAEKLPDVVGKDLADKIQKDFQDPAASFKVYEKPDLKVGGEGMRSFYDKTLPKVANEIGKKWGAKAEKTGISNDPFGPYRVVQGRGELWHVLDRNGTIVDQSQGREGADASAADLNAKPSVSVHTLAIPPSMRESVMTKGQPRLGRLDLFGGRGGKKPPEQAASEDGRFDVPDETKRDRAYSAIVNDFQRIVNLEKAAPNKVEGMSLEHALSAFPGRRFGEAEKLQKQAVEPLKQHLAANNIPPIESPKLGKPSASDYLYALHTMNMGRFDERPTGMSQKDAEAILSRAGPEYTAIRDWNRALNEKRLDTLENSGLISPETRAAWEKKYGQDYVPLRTAKDPMAQLFGTAKGLQVSGKESKAREGRSSKADAPLAFAVETMQTALDRAESNKIGQKLGELVTKNPEPSLWRIESDANKIKEGEERLAFKENGEQRYIVTKDKGLADAFKRITKPDPGVIKLLDPLLKMWHNVIIRYNPIFSLRNIQRDVGEAEIKHAIRGDVGAALSNLKNEAPAIKGAFQAIREEGSGGKWGDVYRDARDNGALIGWREQFSYEDRVKDFEKAFTKTGKIRAFGNLIDDLNRSAELGTRLAAYKAFLDKGMSKPEAAMETRRITADFARRGSLAPIYRRLWLFSGANVQGIAEAARSIKDNPGKASVVIGSLIGAGLVNYQLSKQYGDEHEMDKMSEYDKARHIGVMIGKRKYGFTAPYTFGVFPYIGWKLGELLHGDTTKGDALSNIAQQGVDAMSPLPQGANVLQSLTPTVFRPAMELAQNQKFSGAPIYPEQDQFAKVPKPASKLFFRNVSGVSKEITEGLHTATGGTNVKPGAVEISPEVLDHLAAAMSGGVGSFAKGTWDVVRKMVTGQADEIRATDIPGARAFVTEPSRGAEGQLFKKNVGEVEMSKAQKKAREEPDKPEALRLEGSASDAEKQIRALYKKMDREGMTEQDQNEIQQRIDEIRERFNRRAKPVLRGQ